MFFRRQEGEYRETDRVTRFKLIKSGKHWLRASTSQFGLFKVLRGGVDAAQVTTEVIEEQSSNTLTGLDILKGIAAAGTVFGGAVATQTTVYANDALEKTVESNQTLANTDTVTLGTVKDQEGAQADSLSVSVSQSQSLSEEASKNASKHLSESESQSVSTSTSVSTSASASASTSAVASTSASTSAVTSASQSQAGATSELAKPATSETASNKETSVRKEDAANATADAALSKVITDSLASLQAVETRLSQITSTTSSLVDTTTTAAVATTVSAESNKKAQEDRKRLSKISATMGEYLAKSIGLPNTEAAVAKVNAAVTAIEEALKTPNADLTDVIKQATSAQNSIVNAVLRAHNGKRSHLNGKQMARGVHLLARNPQLGSNAINHFVEDRGNGEKVTYLTSGESDSVKARVEHETFMKATPKFDSNGKVTSIVWTVMTNPAQTMNRTQNTQWFQIPTEVNMPTEIYRTTYTRRVTGQANADFANLPVSNNPAEFPTEYKNNDRNGSVEVIRNFDKVSLNNGDQQFNLLKKVAAHSTQGWGGVYKTLWEQHVKDKIIWSNDPRTIYKHVDVGDQGRVSVMRFETTVPTNVTNAQLRDMTFLYGQGTQATSWAGSAAHKNPLKLTVQQAYPFAARDGGTYIVNQVDAPYNTSEFNKAGLKWWYSNNDPNQAYVDPNQYLVHPGTQDYSGKKGPDGTKIEFYQGNNLVAKNQIGRTPGVFEYNIRRVFPNNEGTLNTPVKFVVKPKTPEITTTLQENVSSQTITVANATPNKKVELYKNNTLLTSTTANAQGVATFSNVQMANNDSFKAKVKIENQPSYIEKNTTKNYVESEFSNAVTARFTDTEKPKITTIVANKGAKVDTANPRKILVYREEEIDVDIKLTDNLKRLDKIKVRGNGANATAPSGKFETNDIVDDSKQTVMNFTTNQNRLGQENNATDTQPSVVKLTGHVGKAYTGNSGSWTRYVAGYDHVGLTNDAGTDNDSNAAKIIVEYRAQAEKYTPTAATQNVDIKADGRVRFDNPETYITNRSSLPTNGTTAGTKTTYAWADAEPTNWTAGQHTRDIIVTYPDGSTDRVTVQFNARDNIAPNVTAQGKTLPTTRPTESDAPLFTVYRGATFNPIVKAWDNSGKLTKLQVKNLPGGVTSGNFTEQNGKTESNQYSGRLINGTVNDNQALGTHIAEVVVSDGTTEVTRYMKYRIVDVVPKNLDTNGEVYKNMGDKLGDAHYYIGTTSNGNLEDDKYFPGGMNFDKWKNAQRGDATREDLINTNPGKWTYNAIATFPDDTKDEASTTRTTFTPSEKEVRVGFVLKPSRPEITPLLNGDVTVAPKTSETTVNRMEITYTPTGSSTNKTLTARKASNGTWSLNETPSGVTINPSTGVVSLPERVTKDGSTLSAFTYTSDNRASDESSTRLVVDKEAPVITATNGTATTGENVDIPLTVVDTGVGLADTNGVVITGLPAGLSYSNGKITGTTTAPAGSYPVTIVAKDKLGNSNAKNPTRITITVQTQASKYNVTTKNNGNFYAVQDEDVANLIPRDFVNGTIPETAKVTWKTAPTTGDVGSGKTAVLTITYPDRSTKDLNYTYQVYPKLETKTNNGQTGNFHAFKNYNRIGGHTSVYTNMGVNTGFNNPDIPMKWEYSYRLNNEGAERKSTGNNPTFSSVWHTEDKDPENQTHKTRYTLNATYPTGRFGAVSADNPALTTSTQWDYAVYEYTKAKDVFETTQGDLAGLGSIVETPKDATKPTDGRTEVPEGTTFVWHNGEKPDNTTVANPGFSIHRISMTLPGDSSNTVHTLPVDREVKVLVKVNPKTPVIVENTISEKGGLPNQSIQINNVVPGATVNLTIAGKTITKTAGPNATSVTFDATDLQPVYAANNGLLPVGDITVNQAVTRRDPSDNTDKVLTSATASGTITRETEAPVAQDTVVEVWDEKTKTWNAVPKSTDASGLVTHTFYAGDKLRFTTKFTDNSSKIANTVVRQGSNTASATDNVLHSTWGTAAPNNITTVTPATATSPATVVQEGTVRADLQHTEGQHVTRAIVAEDVVGNRSEGSRFRLKQGKLAEKYPGVDPTTKFVVADAANLTPEEKAQVFAAIKAANPQTDRKITNYTQNENGSVTITYADGTTNTVQPNVKYGVEKVSDRFYAISDETLADLDLRKFVRGVGNKALPDNTQVTWKTGSEPTFDVLGERTATLLVTHPDGTTDEIPYNYTIYPKVETHTNNGLTGEFEINKGWNHMGGHTQVYTNLNDPAFPSGTNWSYRYNTEQGATETTANRPTFSAIWNNDKLGKETYTVKATYGVSRFGTITPENTVLSSEVSFNYTVLEYTAKQVFETTVGDTAPLASIIANAKEAVKPVDGSPEALAPTGFEWNTNQTPDAAAVANPGYVTRNVKMTLRDSSGKTRDINIPVTIKVNLTTPQIADDQVTNTGGLPNRSITVTNVTPGATVTLRIGSKEIPKTVPAGATSVAFGADELADSNGLLPTGNVTVTQTKVVTNPEGNPETLSTSTTKEITKENEKPKVEVVLQVKDGNNWVDRPKTAVRDSATDEERRSAQGYELYAGDEYRFVVKATDNSGKVRSLEVWDGRTVQDNMTTRNHNSN